MRLDTVKVLGISITKNSKKEILEFLQKYLEKGSRVKGQGSGKTVKSLVIVTPNPEQIVYAKRDPHFAEILNQADVALPDGSGVVWASRQLSPKPLGGAIPGIEFMEELVNWASDQHVPVALIGSWGGLAVKALDCLRKKHPDLVGWAEDGPDIEINGEDLRFKIEDLRIRKRSIPKSLILNPTSIEEDYFEKLAVRVKETGVKIVFIGLGAPKQEYFIENLGDSVKRLAKKQKIQTEPYTLHALPSMIFMSVGGSFDEIGGRISRAPKWVSHLGFKWAWRLVLQPWRIKRQLSLLTFVQLVLREKFTQPFHR